jgi:hypothetical protein
MKTFGDKKARREWKRRFKNEMRGWKKDFQQQMHQGADSWRTHWQQWGPRSYSPFAALLHALLTILFVCALFSLATSHRLFGWWLPAGIPFWAGILIVVALYKFLVCPLKAMNYPAYGSPWGPFSCLVHICIWIGVVWFVIWLCSGHGGDFRDDMEHLPAKLHHAANSLRDWWNQQ